MIGPDSIEPEIPWLDQWQSDLHWQVRSPKQQTQLDLRFCLPLFDDPVLNELIELDRQSYTCLRITGLFILESRTTLGIVTGNRYHQCSIPPARFITSSINNKAVRSRKKIRDWSVTKQGPIWNGHWILEDAFGGYWIGRLSPFWFLSFENSRQLRHRKIPSDLSSYQFFIAH